MLKKMFSNSSNPYSLVLHGKLSVATNHDNDEMLNVTFPVIDKVVSFNSASINPWKFYKN